MEKLRYCASSNSLKFGVRLLFIYLFVYLLLFIYLNLQMVNLQGLGFTLYHCVTVALVDQTSLPGVWRKRSAAA